MEKHKRRDPGDRYFLLEVFECPKEVVLFAAQFGGDNVIIENFTNYGRQRAEFRFEIGFEGLALSPSLKTFAIPFPMRLHCRLFSFKASPAGRIGFKNQCVPLAHKARQNETHWLRKDNLPRQQESRSCERLFLLYPTHLN